MRRLLANTSLIIVIILGTGAALYRSKLIPGTPLPYQDAMLSNRTAICVIKNPKNDTTIKIIKSGQMSKTITQTKMESYSTESYYLNDSNYIYIWSSSNHQPTKFPAPQGQNNNVPRAELDSNYSRIISSGSIVKCKVAVASKSTFEAPSYVNFQEVKTPE